MLYLYILKYKVFSCLIDLIPCYNQELYLIGVPFGLKTTSSLRPLNLLQVNLNHCSWLKFSYFDIFVTMYTYICQHLKIWDGSESCEGWGYGYNCYLCIVERIGRKNGCPTYCTFIDLCQIKNWIFWYGELTTTKWTVAYNSSSTYT